MYVVIEYHLYKSETRAVDACGAALTLPFIPLLAYPLHSILPSSCPPRDVFDFPSTGDIHRIRIWRRPRVRIDPTRWVFAEKERSIAHPSVLGGSSDQNRPFRRWTHGHFALPHRLSFSPTTICLSRRRIRRSRSSWSNGDLGRGV